MAGILFNNEPRTMNQEPITKKTIAIMQPYFFPYIGYFSLMHCADGFILFDTPQYDRKGWMNRNRILSPNDGWQYIRAGIKKPPFRAPIADVSLEEGNEWKKKILSQLECYRKKAPYYEQVSTWVESILTPERTTLVELNRDTLKAILDFIGLECPITIFSEMNLEVGAVQHAGQWALRICEALKYDAYVNSEGGRELFVSAEFAASGIKLQFLKNNLSTYSQFGSTFEPGLSVLDSLLFNGAEKTKQLVMDYVVE